MNLYTASELARLINFIDEDGVIDIDSFNRSQIALQDKQLAVVAYLKNEVSNIELLDNAIKELTARKKAMQTRYDSLKDYLLVNMKANNITEITEANFTFSAKIRKNPPRLVIDDAGKIPGELYIYPIAPAPYPDNSSIKAKLVAGEAVEGARLEQGERVDIK
ncbi:MAG: siphovirus Gp157 family protein [Pseudomonadota bacterium]